MVEEVTEKFKSSKIQDDIKSEITVCSWNILGDSPSGITKRREKVVTETLKERKVSGNISLSHCDIICLQEVPVKTYDAIKKYVPTIRNYDYVITELTRYNIVLYNVSKFKVNYTCLGEAFASMETKKKMYDFIAHNDSRITKAINEDLEWGEKSERAIFKEVLRECRRAKTISGFHNLLDCYKAPKETVTRSPKELLQRRMAIVALQLRNPLSMDGRAAASSQEPILIVVSIHSHKNDDDSRRLLYLLFNFLEKIDSKYQVIIAGDFNLDIRKEKRTFLDPYYISSYDLRSLRKEPDKRGVKLKCIDFIVVSKQSSDWEFVMPVITTAHDMEVSPEIYTELLGATPVQKRRTITNHSPLSATLQLKQRTSTEREQ